MPHRTSTKAANLPSIVNNVVIGNVHIKPWYRSHYPEDVVGGKKVEWLYVCQSCFRYCAEILKFGGHCKVCPLKDRPPPGGVVYEKDDVTIRQVDGDEFKLYAQNLSLFAKLFLETKSVFFDTSAFLYYTLVLQPPGRNPSRNGQVVGFFSKEKISWDKNNVACILVFPPWQRRGLGQILIAASYELSKREAKLGGPERPLSALGRQGYVAYWCGEVARCILARPGGSTLSVRDIGQETYILPDDVVDALVEMGVNDGRARSGGGGNVHVRTADVRAWVEKSGVRLRSVIDVEAFIEPEQRVEIASDENGRAIADQPLRIS